MGAVATPAPPSLEGAILSALSGGDTPSGPLQAGDQVVTQTEAAPAPTVEAPSEPGQPTEAQPAADGAAAVEVVDDFDMGLDPPAQPEAETAPTDEQAEAQPGQQMSRSEADEITRAFLRTQSGRRMRSNDLAMQELAKPPEQGGIGITPTVEQIKEFHQNHLHHQRFIEDFNSGSPEQHAAISHFLFGADQAGNSPPGAVEFVASLPENLASSNAPLYSRLASTIGSQMATVMDQYAAEAVSPEDKARWADAANLVRWANGIPMTQQAAGDGTAPQQGQSERERALEAQLQSLQTERQQARQQAQQQAVRSAQGQFYSTVEGAIAADVDKALAVLKDKVGPVTYDAHRVALLAELRAEAKRVTSNETVRGDIRRALGAVMQTRDPSTSFNGVVTAIRRAYQSTLLNKRQSIIADAGVKLKQQTAVASAKLQQAQQNTEASPTTPSSGIGGVRALPERQANESADQYRDRVLKFTLGS